MTLIRGFFSNSCQSMITFRSGILAIGTIAAAATANGAQIDEFEVPLAPEFSVDDQISSIESALQTESRDPENPCTKLNLSEAQRAQINHMAAQTRAASEELQHHFLETRKAYGRNIIADNSNAEMAHRLDKQSDKITKNLSKIGHNLITGILFHVVNSDQRIPTARCIQYTQREQMKRKLREICETLDP